MQKKREELRLSLSQFLFCLASVAAIALVLFKSDVVSPAMLAATKVCINSVIPSLFPFMVLCDIFVNSGAAEILAKVFGGLFKTVFGIGKDGSVAVLLGLVFGFPVGTKSAISLYESGRINKSELCRLLCFCNGPSSAFLIGAVGIGLFGSRDLGIVLCAAEIFSAFVIGIASRAFLNSENSEEKENKKTLPKCKGSASSIVDAVTSSALSMLFICAFIVFFSAVTGIVDDCAGSLGVSATVRALITGFFEMTGGVRAIASTGIDRYAACLLCAAAVGWSGMSVHFQFISLCRDTGVGYRAYFISKSLRAALDLLFVAAILRIFEGKIEFGESATSSFLAVGSFHPIYLISIASVIVLACRKLKIEVEKFKNN